MLETISIYLIEFDFYDFFAYLQFFMSCIFIEFFAVFSKIKTFFSVFLGTPLLEIISFFVYNFCQVLST